MSILCGPCRVEDLACLSNPENRKDKQIRACNINGRIEKYNRVKCYHPPPFSLSCYIRTIKTRSNY